MKNHLFVALVLCVGLALPAAAQQDSANTSAQPAASTAQPSQPTTTQPTTTPNLEPLSDSRSTDFWDGDEPSVSSLLAHPFASKEYVRRHVQPIRDRLEELDEITASDKKTIRDVDAREQQGLQKVSEKTSLADEHATEAARKAQVAHEAVAGLDTRVTVDETEVRNLDQFKSGGQAEIHFHPGDTALSKQAKDALDEIAAQLKGQHGYILEVQGFSTGQGQTAIAHSRKMADAVVRYMALNHQIPPYRMYVLGMGNASVGKGRGTRVEISVMKNDLEQAAR
jgi:outer membrane protein OmpA-like peptidoglycan-associated protein